MAKTLDVTGSAPGGAVLLGYHEHVTIEAEELNRVTAVARARPIILRTWSVCMRQATLT